METHPPDKTPDTPTHSVAVSVLMPLYKNAETLEASIESVMAQTFEAWELLLIDDASPEPATLEIAQDWCAKDPRIKLVRVSQNGGAAAARNCGLDKAQGRFIAFLDADDLWSCNKLQHQLDFMKRTNAAISFTGYSRISHPEGRLIKQISALPTVDYGQLLKYNPMGCLTVIYDTAICGKVMMPDLPRQHDYALWLKIVGRHGPALGLNENLALYRVRAQSLSSDKKGAAQDMWQVLRHHEKLPMWRALWAFAGYARHSLRHRVFQRPDPQNPVLLPRGDF